MQKILRLVTVATLCVATYIGSTIPAAHGQTRAECNYGIAFIKEELSRSADPKQRSALMKALRDAERELGEGEYDECLEAIEDARIAIGEHSSRTPRARQADERLQADFGLPVTVEDAFVTPPGEVETEFRFFYDRVQRRIKGDEEEGTLRRSGRNRYMPGAEIEIGLVPGLSAMLASEYRLGDADDTKNGEVEFGGKWNFLAAQGWVPALSVSAGLTLPYGYQNDTVESSLALLGSLALSNAVDAPYLHANAEWSHAFNQQEDDRANLFAGVLGLAVPISTSTALIFDTVHAQNSERGHVDNLFELGIRQVLPGETLLAAGAGFGFGNSDTDFRILIGVQKSF